MADDVHRIELRAKSIEQLRLFLSGADADLGCRPVVRKVGEDYVVEAYMPLPAVERLRSASRTSAVTMNVIENASEIGRLRQTEVGTGNRFAARITPSGLGVKE